VTRENLTDKKPEKALTVGKETYRGP